MQILRKHWKCRVEIWSCSGHSNLAGKRTSELSSSTWHLSDWVLICLDLGFHVSSRMSSSGSSSMSKATANALRSCFSFATDSTPI
jgi:hypothetical protein